MHRIDDPTAVQQIPTIAPVGLPGYFFNGDPRRGRLATKLDQDFFNAVQEEIAHVIEQADLVLDKFRFDQLLLAILIHIERNIPEFPPMPFLPLLGGTMQGQIYQHIWPTVDPELTHKAYVDARDNAVIAHSDAMDVHYHNEAVNYANARAIQEGDRAQNNAWAWDQVIYDRAAQYANARAVQEGDRAQNQAWAWDQPIWDRVNWIDATQGGLAAYGSDGLFTVPGAARVLEVTCTGGGGGGGACHDQNHAAAGGGSGGTSMNAFAVSPGQQFWVTVGRAGEAGRPGSGSGGQGGAGGASQFGDVLGATGGGGGGGSQSSHPAGGPGGGGFGSGVHIAGGYGGDGWDYRAGTRGLGGNGAASYWGGGGRAGTGTSGSGAGPAVNAIAFGSGGGGTYIGHGDGGYGAGGIVRVRWHR